MSEDYFACLGEQQSNIVATESDSRETGFRVGQTKSSTRDETRITVVTAYFSCGVRQSDGAFEARAEMFAAQSLSLINI